MPDYNLSGLNPRVFEHLTQSLAQKEIATGLRPFGDGPDGGREATFHGRMTYPSAAQPWEGYLVVQCKFLQSPSGDRAQDAEWLRRQILDELNKYRTPRPYVQIPEFYLLATNVALSAVGSTGTKDRMLALLNTHAEQLGFRAIDLWDYDKFRLLLDNNESVRRTYSAFISSSDVLNEALSVFAHRHEDVRKALDLFLQSELRADEFARLEQAGDTGQKRASLAEVFVDLPYTDKPLPDTSNAAEHRNTVLSTLLDASTNVLRPSALITSGPRESSLSSRPVESSVHSRFVLVGGPGQGKSTLGQYLCQLFRAALLEQRPAHALGPEVREALTHFSSQCSASGQRLPRIRRFPIRIVLDNLAAEIADRRTDSVLSYVRTRIERLSGRSIQPQDLEHWLASYPSVVILDGLDEVPASSNRAELLEAIIRFSSEIGALDADVLVVATTRPQGYSDEFAPHTYRHLYLAPLTTEEALHYASRLVATRYAGEPERQQRIVERLRAAVREESSKRLMRSPLQVTIMATLVDRIGKPPQQRWELFAQYYDVIYQREMERDIPASRILRERRRDVSAIHARVGLELQVASETAGATEARLGREAFLRVVEGPLREAGYEGAELELRARDISEAALKRLVFLVGLESERIGFEIRSLQEFMAAEALMEGSDEEIALRLTAVAAFSHWRNVLLFATGRCFAQRKYLADTVLRICLQLNDRQHDVLSGAVLAGSDLALDILEEGLTREYPIYARQFANTALRLLELPLADYAPRLAAVYAPGFAALYEERIRERLTKEDANAKRAAWYLLVRLADLGVDWAIRIAEKEWKTGGADVWQAMLASTTKTSSVFSVPYAARVVSSIAPAELGRSSRRGAALHRLLSAPGQPPWLAALVSLVPIWRLERGQLRVPLRLGNPDAPLEGFAFNGRTIIAGTEPEWESLRGATLDHPKWKPLLAAASFATDPSHESLARAIRAATEPHCRDHNQERWLPWPLAASLGACPDEAALLLMAQLAESGMLGRYEDWIAAEERWSRAGVTERDLLHESARPVSADLREVGIPIKAFGMSLTAGALDVLGPLLKAFSVSSGPNRTAIAHMCLFVIQVAGSEGFEQRATVPPSVLQELTNALGDRRWAAFAIEGLSLPSSLSVEWAEALDSIGRAAEPVAFGNAREDIATVAWKGLSDYPQFRRGLTAVFAQFGAPSPNWRMENILQSPPDANDRDRFWNAVSCLWCLDCSSSRREQLTRELRETIRSGTRLANPLVHFLARWGLSSTSDDGLALAMEGIMLEADELAVANYFELLRTLRNKRRSDVSRHEQRKALALPAAY